MKLDTDLERAVWAAAYAAAFVQPQHPQTQASSSIQLADEAVRQLRNYIHERDREKRR